MIGVLITCDATDCGEKAMVLLEPWDTTTDIASQQFTLDTEWISIPNTWTLTELGTFCPDHH